MVQKQGDGVLKFEAKWLEEEGYMERVEKAWLEAMKEGASSVMEIQNCVLQDLHDCDKNVLGELGKRINKVKKELEHCRRQHIS
jgi:hypothetical protein